MFPKTICFKIWECKRIIQNQSKVPWAGSELSACPEVRGWMYLTQTIFTGTSLKSQVPDTCLQQRNVSQDCLSNQAATSFNNHLKFHRIALLSFLLTRYRVWKALYHPYLTVPAIQVVILCDCWLVSADIPQIQLEQLLQIQNWIPEPESWQTWQNN